MQIECNTFLSSSRSRWRLLTYEDVARVGAIRALAGFLPAVSSQVAGQMMGNPRFEGALWTEMLLRTVVNQTVPGGKQKISYFPLSCRQMNADPLISD